MNKVLYLIDTLQTGGAEKSILEISKRLKNISPVVCTLFNKKPDLEDEYIKANIPIYKLDLPQGHFKWWKEGRKKLKAVIEKVRPDIVHAHLYKSEILARTTRFDKQIPLIGAFVNDSYSAERYQQQNVLQNIKLNFYKYIDVLTASRVAYYTSVSAAIAVNNCAALGIPEERVKVIYRGRNTDQFNVVHPVYEPAHDLFIFQVVARLLRRKGYLELIDAIALLKQRSKHSFVVRAAGDGVDANFIKTQAEKKGITSHLEFLGSRSDVPVLLAQAHCFVFPSHYEGQGGALVEAMLAAKPIIATDIPVFREQIEQSHTGMLFKLMNAEDMATQMQWIMDHYAEGIVMGKEALKSARQRFDINRIAEQYDEFYLNIS